MRYNYIYRAILLLLLSGLFASCIAEDQSNCPPDAEGIRLRFRLNPVDNNDIQPDDISSLEIFVFDDSGKYRGKYRDDSPRVQDDSYCIDLPLTAGNYHFVAWGNTPGSDYTHSPSSLIEDIHQLADVQLSFLRQSTDTVDYMPGHLFHGSHLQTRVTRGTTQEVVIPITQNTYTIQIEIADLQTPADLCRAVISDEHDAYSFLNEPISSAALHYSTPCTLIGAEQHTTLRMLQLRNDSPARLKIYDKLQTQLYDASLIDLIRQAGVNSGSAMDLSRIHEYTVRLAFDYTLGEFTVTINGWNAQEEDHNIHPQSRMR
ncbi:MAG TPA: FimB/Mfa2 family fimbrial subunit [Bacteroides reticulotermitis]|nr:FimB/Mfa2 family fimbrial subunit [Bacteroides reticulotermitis]